eukprot:gene1094-2128_t
MLDTLRKLDAYPKAIEEFRIKTVSGAIISIVSIVLMVVLFLSELSYYYKIDTVDNLYINTTRAAKLKVDFDITFHGLPCKLLSLDVYDDTGSTQKEATHELFKHKISNDGKKLGPVMKHEIGDTLQTEEALTNLHRQHTGSCELTDEEKIDCGFQGIGQESCEAKGCCWRPGGEGKAWCFFKGLAQEVSEKIDCGNCYGAGHPGECCNTCDEVKAAYERKGWRLRLQGIPQCQKEAFRQTMMEQFAEDGGCQLYGHLELNQASGHFLIAPHKGLHSDSLSLSGGLFNLLELISFTFDQFNISHTMNGLSFGDHFPGIRSPLDGQTRSLEDTHGMYQYYIKVVPTRYKRADGSEVESNQYSVTEHLRHLAPGSGRGLPGLYFYYEVSPIQAVFQEKRKGFLPFLTSVCAIVGGAFTVMGICTLCPDAVEKLEQFE